MRVSILVREGQFDVVIAAGPRTRIWPSVGVRSLSTLCADVGLTVGVFGGEFLSVRGVIPSAGTGGILLIEDSQKRIHRIRARAIVKVSSSASFLDPFPGWNSPGLIPISTAVRLLKESQVAWKPATVILGTGNRALRLGSSLLETGVSQVFCIEAQSQFWGAKRFSGWEVERRRFEVAGGKLLEAQPVSLTPKAALLWELRLQDEKGIRILEVSRVISAGPFRDSPGVREYPPGSLLFELEQTASLGRENDVEGWVLEKERGRLLAGKIIKSLVADLGEKREELDQVFKRAKSRLKRYLRHREEPFTPVYQGKWVSPNDGKVIKQFKGVPQRLHLEKSVASIECFEEIPCNLCQSACPVSAIEIGKIPRNTEKILTEELCTACGLCLLACPSGVPVMLHEKVDQSMSRMTLPWRGRAWKEGEFATLLNRRGESLGSARVVGVKSSAEVEEKYGGQAVEGDAIQLVELEVPNHLLWDARGIKVHKVDRISEDVPFEQPDKVEVYFDGEKRLVRDSIPVSVALFEIGHGRAEDVLMCSDGSCGLCEILVDGVKKQACQTTMRRGMTIKRITSKKKPETLLCPCVGVSKEKVLDRMKKGTLKSPEAVLSVTHVGSGACNGMLCMETLRRVMQEQGLDASQWIDWRFPWSQWKVVTPVSG